AIYDGTAAAELEQELRRDRAGRRISRAARIEWYLPDPARHRAALAILSGPPVQSTGHRSLQPAACLRVRAHPRFPDSPLQQLGARGRVLALLPPHGAARQPQGAPGSLPQLW